MKNFMQQPKNVIYTLMTVCLALVISTIVHTNVATISAFSGDLTYLGGAKIGGDNYEEPTATAVDGMGNVYYLGAFDSEIDFDPTDGEDFITPFDYENFTSTDVYLTKLNADGTYDWTLTWGGTGEEYPRGLVANQIGGGVTVLGSFEGNFNLDPVGATEPVTLEHSADGFAVKINANGTYNWGYTFNSSSYLDIKTIYSQSNGGVLIGGCYEGIADFDALNGGYAATSSEQNGFPGSYNCDPFILELSSTGTFVRFTSFDHLASNVSYGNSYVTSLYEDGVSRIYFMIEQYGGLDGDPTGGFVEHTIADGQTKTVFGSITASGNYRWSHSIGGNGGLTADAIIVDTNIDRGLDNLLYIVGTFTNDIDFDPSSESDDFLYSNGSDMFIAQYETNGAYISATKFDTTGSGGFNIADVILSPDNTSFLYIAGGFHDTIDLDPSPSDGFLSAEGSTDGFLVKLRPETLLPEWQISFGDIFEESVVDLDIDQNGKIYLVGLFFNRTNLRDYGGIDEFYSIGDADIFYSTYQELDILTNLVNISTLPIYGINLSTTGDVSIASSENVDIDLPIRIVTVGAEYPLMDVRVDLTQNRDWENRITAETSIENGKSYVHIDGGLISLDGVNSSYTLYVPKFAESESVRICPNATSFDQVFAGCSGEEILDLTDFDVTTVTLAGETFWRVANRTGTGGQSVLPPTAIEFTISPTEIENSVESVIDLNFIPNRGYSVGDTITFTFSESLGSTPTSGTVDSDGDGIDDGFFSEITQTTATYTFTQNTTQATIEGLMFQLTIPSTDVTGDIEVELSDSIGNVDNSQISIQSVNPSNGGGGGSSNEENEGENNSNNPPGSLPSTGIQFIDSNSTLIFGLIITIIGLYIYRFRIFKFYKLQLTGKGTLSSGVRMLNFKLRK